MKAAKLHAGLISLIFLMGSFILFRASHESSIWIDETYSLYLTRRTFAEIIDLASSDTHPPLYWLLLKIWLKVPILFGHTPGILWARLLNGIVWLLLIIGSYVAGQRLIARDVANVAAWCVGASAIAANIANDARNYALATTAVFVAFSTLIDILLQNQSNRNATKWLLFSLAASIAFWAHLLSVVAIAAVSAVGLVVMVAQRNRRHLLSAYVAAHALIILFCLPWIPNVIRQMNTAAGNMQSFTPPTIINLMKVFAVWYPFGELGLPNGNLTPWNPWGEIWFLYPENLRRLLQILGWLSCLAPIVVFASALTNSKRNVRDSESTATMIPKNCAGYVAAAALGVTVLNVLGAWVVEKSGLSHTFHGPRYQVMTGPVWVFGLVAASCYARSRWNLSSVSVWVVMIPWLLCGASGNLRTLHREQDKGLSRWKEQVADILHPGDTLFVFPPEIAQFHRKSLAEYDVRRIEELPRLSRDSTQVVVLNLNCWRILDNARDVYVRTLLSSDKLSSRSMVRNIPSWSTDYVLTRLPEYNHNVSSEVFTNGVEPPLPPIPSTALSVALAQNQRLSDGFTELEMEHERLHRFAVGGHSTVAFEPALPPGAYTLHIHGWRPALPEAETDFDIEFTSGTSTRITVPPGPIDLNVPFTLNDEEKSPRVTIRSKPWRPIDFGASHDKRLLTFQFQYAWIEPTR